MLQGAVPAAAEVACVRVVGLPELLKPKGMNPRDGVTAAPPSRLVPCLCLRPGLSNRLASGQESHGKRA